MCLDKVCGLQRNRKSGVSKSKRGYTCNFLFTLAEILSNSYRNDMRVETKKGTDEIFL